MIDRLKAWLTEAQEGVSGERDELQLAVAALLMEMAEIDGHLDEGERRTVRRLLAKRFGLDATAAERLTAAGEKQAERSTQLFGIAGLINERFSLPKRVELIEMLWEVAYADGALDPLEDSTLRRIGGLIDVSDHERGEAKLRVQCRLGISVG